MRALSFPAPGLIPDMARLKQIRPRAGSPVRPRHAPLVAVAADRAEAEAVRDRARDRGQEWRGWYKTAAWQRLRWSVLVRDLFTCRRCGRVEGVTRLLVADHVVPHRGDSARFWDPANLQCLCKACHDGAKQAEDRAAGDG